MFNDEQKMQNLITKTLLLLQKAIEGLGNAIEAQKDENKKALLKIEARKRLNKKIKKHLT